MANKSPADVPSPPMYTPAPSGGSSQNIPGFSQYTPGVPSQYTPGPPQYTPGPSMYSPHPSSYIPGGHQQSSTNVSVVNMQPSVAPSILVLRSRRDHYLTLSVILTVLAIMCIGVGWPSLLCTIPAIIVSVLARNDDEENDIVSAKRKANVSVFLNIAAVIMFVVVMIITIVGPIVAIATASTATTLRGSDVCSSTTAGTYTSSGYYQPGYTYYYYC